MKTKRPLAFFAAVFCLVWTAHPLIGADPVVTTRTSAPTALVEHIRGHPATAADLIEMAGLRNLPELTAGAGDGDYSLKPPHTPAPEQSPRADVPKGRIIHFAMASAESKFYPDTGLRGTTATRDVTVYIPSQYVPGT